MLTNCLTRGRTDVPPLQSYHYRPPIDQFGRTDVERARAANGWRGHPPNATGVRKRPDAVRFARASSVHGHGHVSTLGTTSRNLTTTRTGDRHGDRGKSMRPSRSKP